MWEVPLSGTGEARGQIFQQNDFRFSTVSNFSKRTNKALGSFRLSGQCQNKISQKRNKMGSVILGYGYTISFLFTQVKMEIDLTKGGVSDASGNILDCVFFLSLHR